MWLQHLKHVALRVEVQGNKLGRQQRQRRRKALNEQVRHAGPALHERVKVLLRVALVGQHPAAAVDGGRQARVSAVWVVSTLRQQWTVAGKLGFQQQQQQCKAAGMSGLGVGSTLQQQRAVAGN